MIVAPIVVVTDENVPRSIAEFLSQRGHDVRAVTDLVMVGSPDELVADAARQIGGILVSWNHRDFVDKRNENKPLYPDVHLITFRCHENEGLERLTDEIEVIEFQYARLVAKGQVMQAVIGKGNIRFLK